MPYLLRGGPRDRQLVDDLPRGYRPVGADMSFDAMDLGGVAVDKAIWEGTAPGSAESDEH